MLETFWKTILSFEVFSLDMPDSKKYLRFVIDLLDKYSAIHPCCSEWQVAWVPVNIVEYRNTPLLSIVIYR